MGKTHPPSAKEFRTEAVRLVRESGKPLATIARDLGVSEPTLRGWRKQAELDSGQRTDGLTTEERDEVHRLRREVRVLREERDILRKVFHAASRHQRKDLSVPRGIRPLGAPVSLGRRRLVPRARRKV